MSSVDNAIARIQDIALALSTIPDANGNIISIRNAPDYPIDSPPAYPACITHLSGGEFLLANRTVHHNFPMIASEFHFDRVNLKQAYKQINAVVIEFPQRLAGDPTLDGTVDTIVGGVDSRITYIVRPFVWKEQTGTSPAIVSQMLMFAIPIKLLKAPVATST